MQLAGFVICGLHFYVWLSVKHELCNQVHMWERLRGETEIYRQVQPLFKPSEGFKYEHFWASFFFAKKSLPRRFPHDMNAAWAFCFGVLLHTGTTVQDVVSSCQHVEETNNQKPCTLAIKNKRY